MKPVKEPYGLVLQSIGKPSSNVPFMMPKRVADTNPMEQIADFTGSGPNPPSGTLESSDVGLRVLPAIYYSQQVGQKTVIGLGLSRPFGLKSKWDEPDTFTGRYICLECGVSSWSINPTIAYRVVDRLSIGAGLDLRLSNFTLSRRLGADPNPFPVPTDVAELTLDSGTDTGIGFNVGLLASPTENKVQSLVNRNHRLIECQSFLSST